MTGQRSAPDRLVVPLVAGMAAWGAGLVFHRAFGYGPLLLPLAVAAFVPPLCLALCAVRRRLPPVECTVPGSAVLGLLVCALTLFGDGGGTGWSPWSAVGAAAEAAPRGWIRLLGHGLPAPATPRLLCFPFLMTWFAALLGTEAALRLRAGGIACLPSVSLLIIGVAWCVPGEGSALPQAVVVTAAAGALLALPHADRAPGDAIAPATRRPMSRRALTAGVWTTSVATAATAVTWSVPWPAQSEGYDVRRHVTAPVHTSTSVDPLAQLAHWRRSPGTPLFSARGPATERWRLCALTVFDGQRWAPEGTFAPTGGLVPAGAESRARTQRTVRHRVVLSGLDGGFLPVPAEPVRVSGPAVAISPRDGAVLVTRPSGRGTSYFVDSAPRTTPPPVERPGLRVATAGRAGPAAGALPPGAPGALRELTRPSAADTDAGSDGPYARAAVIATRLREGYTHVPDAPGVTTYGGVARFLAERQGPASVFGAAFVLAARQSGLPARLVVGFAPGASGGGAREHRTVEVTGRDARVWGEVYFENVGWLPFDPVPGAGKPRSVDVRPSATPERPTPSPSPTRPSAAHAPSPSPESASSPRRATPRALASDPSTWLLPLSLTLFGLLFLTRALRLTVLPVLRERAARRAALPSDRVRGAWDSAVRRLGHCGVEVPSSASVTDVGRLLAQAAGTGSEAAASGLARAAQRALYGEPGPSGSGRTPCVGAEEADRAWDLGDRLAKGLRRRSGLGGSPWWPLVVPGPLLSAWRGARTKARESREKARESQGADEADTSRRSRTP
ncbi:transglutaminase domain-containing protein [Streptomyces phaeolivaceus]|uniref:Transglutaminase domain-containing protein n=1 Tax=Streptomyces phaeolivaceus TaxID=2653200 RepID=A0A5P8KD62_9ACTN|nr:transglutaminase domain-containing protein [Streptomyces phaeolivaceus]QFR00947.1 transglutaminase domain-containing protein [Streptomyces phaeolivaceus]